MPRRGCGGSCREEIPGILKGRCLVDTWELSVTGVDPKLGWNAIGELDGVICLREAPSELVPRPLVVENLGFFFLTGITWELDFFSGAELDSESESRSLDFGEVS